MIEFLRGKLLRADADHIVLDVAGVGYGVAIPEPTRRSLGTTGEEVALHTVQVVREDALELYGFSSLEERTVFRIFLNVSGVGPRTALDVLSTVSIPQLALAIQSGQVDVLTRIPGIGRKRAERLIVELRDRVKDFPTVAPSLAAGAVAGDGGDAAADGAPGAAEGDVFRDAVAAMVELGFKEIVAQRHVGSALRNAEDSSITVADLVKKALQMGR